MKTRIRIIQLATCLMTALLVLGQPAETLGGQNFDNLVARWRTDRDNLVKSITRSWLRGADAETLKPDIASLVALETRLAVDGTIPLYMTHFSDSRDTESVLSDLVRSYLRQRGIEFQTSDFFVGKTYRILRRDAAVLPDSQENEPPKFRFQRWEKSPAR